MEGEGREARAVGGGWGGDGVGAGQMGVAGGEGSEVLCFGQLGPCQRGGRGRAAWPCSQPAAAGFPAAAPAREPRQGRPYTHREGGGGGGGGGGERGEREERERET